MAFWMVKNTILNGYIYARKKNKNLLSSKSWFSSGKSSVFCFASGRKDYERELN